MPCKPIFIYCVCSLFCLVAAKHHASKRSADLQIVQETWPQIYENAEENGVAILKAFLDKYNYYSMFKKFDGLPHDDSIKQNKVFRMHARMIMTNINTAIMNAHKDKSPVPDLLKALGKSHVRKGVTKAHVDNLFGVIEDTIKSSFGFSAGQLKAWHKVLGDLSGYMKNGIPK